MSGTIFSSGSGDGSTNATTICLVYDSETVYKWVAAVRAGVALSSLLFCLGVIFVILSYKRYTFFPQRLVLYLAVAALLHSLSYTISRVKYTGQRSMVDNHCLFAGLFELYTGWVELLVVTLIMVNLFSVIVCGHSLDKCWLETLLVSLCYSTPVLWCWIPFVQLTYGTHGPWCGIRVFNDDCTPHNLGDYLRFFLWQIPLYVGFLALYIVSLVLIVVKLNRDAKTWESSQYDPVALKQKKKLIKEFKHLIWYPSVFLALQVPLLINQIYEAVRPTDPKPLLWMLEAVTAPLAGTAMALIYGFDSQTRQMLRRLELKNTCTTCCMRAKKEPQVRVYECEIETRYGDSVEGVRARRIIYEEERLAAINAAQSNNSPTEVTASTQLEA